MKNIKNYLSILIIIAFVMVGCQPDSILPDKEIPQVETLEPVLNDSIPASVESINNKKGVYKDPDSTGVLHYWCPDSAFMLLPKDILVVYNSPSLEEVYHVDSVITNSTTVSVLIQRIYSSSPDSQLCNTPIWDTLFSVGNEQLKARCKEVFQPYILAADTCQ